MKLKSWVFFLLICLNGRLLAEEASVKFELRTTQDIIDFTNGCCFFGVGGGGDPQFGQRMLQEALDAGKTIRVIDSSELKADSYTLSPFLMGSAGSDTPQLQQQRKRYGLTQEIVHNMPKAAAELLLKQAKVKLDAIIPAEIGGGTTASALATAAWLDVPAVDGDYAGGRALPEVSQMVPIVNGLSLCPLYSVDAFDNQVCILKTSNSNMIEYLGKLVASASFGLAGQAGLLIRFKEAQGSLEKGTLSRAYQLGKALRQARENNQDIVKCITDTVGAYLVLKGNVTKSQADTIDFCYIGEQVIEGIGEFQNHQIKIWFKNEYLECWLDGKPYVCSPDLICLVSYPDGHPMINNQVKIGDQVAVFAVVAPPILTSKKALLRLDPHYFGFDFDYVPFSKRKMGPPKS